MRIAFDRGTILISDSAAGSPGSTLPGAMWDGRVAAYRCPARFHQEIVGRLTRSSVRFVDDVPPVGQLPPLVAPTLRPYQDAALCAWHLAEGRGVVVLPTGSGKTRLALAAIAQARTATLCLVPTRVLLDQWAHEIEATLAISPGRFGDGQRTIGPITVATFESGWRHMSELGDRFGLLIVDEVHHFGTGQRDEALEMCTAPSRLGLSATPPEGAAAARVEQLIGPTVFSLGIHTLVGSYLAPFEVHTMHLELDAREREEYMRMRGIFRTAYAQFLRFNPRGSWAEFSRAAVRSDDGRRALGAWRRLRAITTFPRAKRETLAVLLARHREERTLIFTGDNTTAYAVARSHLVMPITCDIGRAERACALEHFRAGRLRALVSAQVLNEGLDVPDAEVGIVVAGSRGKREHVQRVGRLLRTRPNKRALVYELVVRGTREERDAAVRARALAA